MDELLARLVGEADDRGLAGRHGASSTRAHLMATYRMSAGEAGRTVKAARALCGPSALTEPTRRACASGAVSAEQAVVVATATNRLSPTIDPTRVEEAQIELLDQAQRLSFQALQIAANYMVEAVDPDGADETLEQQLLAEEERARKQAMFVGQCGPDGIARGRFTIPNLTMTMLKKSLDAFASPRRNDPLVDDGTDAPVAYQTRMGHAFCELIEHLPTYGLPQHGVARGTSVVGRKEALSRQEVAQLAW